MIKLCIRILFFIEHVSRRELCCLDNFIYKTYASLLDDLILKNPDFEYFALSLCHHLGRLYLGFFTSHK